MSPMPYSVTFWGSHPDRENDDCWTGEDFATEAEARALFVAAEESPMCCASTAFIMLDGPGLTDVEIRLATTYNARHAFLDDSEWQRERAMQAGMMVGCEAYNDEMGW